MTLLRFDGFDLGDFATRYTGTSGGTTVSGSNTRFNAGLAFQTAAWTVAYASITASATVITGCALHAGTANMYLAFYGDGGTLAHVTVEFNTSGTIVVYRGGSGGTVLTTLASAFNSAAWYYVEVKAIVSDTVGVVEIRLNGASTPIISITGADTRNGGTLTDIDSVSIMDNGGTGYWDDWYILNTGGSAPHNTFLGDCRVNTLIPTGNGNSSQLLGSDANSTDNYLLVDEIPASSADYVGSSTTGQKDTYVMGNLDAAVATVFATQEVAHAAKSDAGAATLKTVIRTASTDYASSAFTLGTSYAPFTNIRVQNPNTAAAWTPAGVDGVEMGVEVG